MSTISRKLYTESEKKKLLSIVEKYKHIVDGKCTSAGTWANKRKAWAKITAEYNSSNVIDSPRTVKQLEKAYSNHKTRIKSSSNMPNSIERKMFEGIEIRDPHVKKEILQPEESYNPYFSNVEVELLALDEQSNPLSSNGGSVSDVDLGQDIFNDSEEQQKLDIQDLDGCDDSSPSTVPINKLPSKDNGRRYQQILMKHEKLLKSTATFKKLFYKKKLEAAIVEKRTNMVKYKIALRKAKLIEMELKMKQFEWNSKNTKRLES